MASQNHRASVLKEAEDDCSSFIGNTGEELVKLVIDDVFLILCTILNETIEEGIVE